MKQLIPLCDKVGKILLSTTPATMSTIASTTQTDTIIKAKPHGWDLAKPYYSIPGPKALPLIGNTWRFFPFIGDLHGHDYFKLSKLFHKKYGNIARLGGLKLPDLVMIYALDDIEYLFRNEGVYPIRDVTSKSFGYYRKNIRPEVFQGYAGIGDVQGKEWHDVRSKLNHIVMHPQTVLQYVETLDIVAAQLVEKMRHLAKSHPLREMPDSFIKCIYAWTLESIMVVCLNKQLGCLEINLSNDSEPTKIIEATTEMFQLFVKIERTSTFKNIYKTKTWDRFTELMDFLTFTFLRDLKDATCKLEKNRNLSSENTTILEQLLKTDEKLAISTAIDFLIGGVDTTGRVAAAALYYLAKTPNAQTALRDELKTLLPNKDFPITKEVLSKASYLRAVIKETSRLAPIGCGVLRQTAKDMVLGGYQIPKGRWRWNVEEEKDVGMELEDGGDGWSRWREEEPVWRRKKKEEVDLDTSKSFMHTNILTSNLVLSHSDKNYIQAKHFIPERWLRTTTENLSVKSTNSFVTLPFGFGVRSCLGKRLAIMELEIGIAKIIRNFYVEWHYQDATFTTNPFYGIIDPLRIRIHEVEQ